MRVVQKLSAVLTLVFSLALAACGGDKSTGPVAVEGSYTLRTVNGQPLPGVVYQEPGYKLEVVSATLTLNADASFTDSGTWRETNGTTVTTSSSTDVGTWTRNGNSFTLVYPATGGTLAGTISGSSLSFVVNNTVPVVYSK